MSNCVYPDYWKILKKSDQKLGKPFGDWWVELNQAVLDISPGDVITKQL